MAFGELDISVRIGLEAVLKFEGMNGVGTITFSKRKRLVSRDQCIWSEPTINFDQMGMVGSLMGAVLMPFSVQIRTDKRKGSAFVELRDLELTEKGRRVLSFQFYDTSPFGSHHWFTMLETVGQYVEDEDGKDVDGSWTWLVNETGWGVHPSEMVSTILPLIRNFVMEKEESEVL